MVLASLLGARLFLAWVIPCSHVRVFAHRLGRLVPFLLIAVASGVLRTWVVPGPLCPANLSKELPMYDPKRKEALRRDADIPHAAVPSGPFPGWVRGRSERFADPNVLTRRIIRIRPIETS